MKGTAVQARAADVEPHTTGDLEAWGGIVSGTVEAFADALGTDCETVLQAAESVPVLVDTAEPKGQGEDRDRPTDPALRSLAVTESTLERLREAVAEDSALPAGDGT